MAKGEGNQPAHVSAESGDKSKDKAGETAKPSLSNEAQQLMQQLSVAGKQAQAGEQKQSGDTLTQFIDTAKDSKPGILPGEMDQYLENQKQIHKEADSAAKVIEISQLGIFYDAERVKRAVQSACDEINKGNKQDPHHAEKVYEDMKKNHPSEASLVHLERHKDGSVTIEPNEKPESKLGDKPGDKPTDKPADAKAEEQKRVHSDADSAATLIYSFDHGYVHWPEAKQQQQLKEQCDEINKGNKQDSHHAENVYADLQKNHPEEAKRVHLEQHKDGPATIEPGAEKPGDKPGDKPTDAKAAEQKRIDVLAERYGKNLSLEGKQHLKEALAAVMDGAAEALKKIPGMPKDVVDAMKESLQSLGFRVGTMESHGPGSSYSSEITIVPPGSHEGIKLSTSYFYTGFGRPGEPQSSIEAVTVSDKDVTKTEQGMGSKYGTGPEITGESKTAVAEELKKVSDAANKAPSAESGDKPVIRTPEAVMQQAMAFLQAESHGDKFNENESKLVGDLLKNVIEHVDLDPKKIETEAQKLGISDERLRKIVEQCLQGVHDVFGANHMGPETGPLNKLSGDLGGMMEKGL